MISELFLILECMAKKDFIRGIMGVFGWQVVEKSQKKVDLDNLFFK